MGSCEPIKFKYATIDSESPENPHIKAVGDIDGDGFIDVVVASSNGGPLVWYEYPDWKKHVIAPSGKWSTDAKLVDMDGDGDLDILILEWYTHNRIEWYENPKPEGNPATEPWKCHIIGSPRAHNIEVGDIDGDGNLEIVTRSQGKDGNAIIIWKRISADLWTERAIPCPPGEGLALGDIDRDGDLDIVIGGRWYDTPEDIFPTFRKNLIQKRKVWLCNPFQEHIFADWTPDSVVKVADMNNDGRLDIVLTRSEGHYRLSWFEAPPEPKNGGWTEHIVDDSVDFAHSLVICDMNNVRLVSTKDSEWVSKQDKNDNEPDIVTAEMHQSPRKRVMVYLNERNAMNWKQQVIAVTGSHNLCVADIGNNGTLDIIGANWSGDYQPVEMWEQCAVCVHKFGS